MSANFCRNREKTTSFKKRSIKELSNALINNGAAIDEGIKRKKWTRHDLKTIRPLTHPQGDMFESYMNDYDICAYGSAGTGKTLVALYLAMLDVLDESKPVNRVIIVRSIVSTRDPGFLKGTLEEKSAPHECTYPPLFKKMFGKASTYADMKEAGLVEFHTSSFVRGLTWDNAVVVFDEAANTTLDEFDSVVTRLGDESKLYVLGDSKQNDLAHKSGFTECLRIMDSMGCFSMVRFTSHDVVRSGFVKEWIQTRESLGI